MGHVNPALPVMCPWCQESEEDAEHILHACPRFQQVREQGWGGDVPDLAALPPCLRLYGLASEPFLKIGHPLWKGAQMPSAQGIP
eukprot:243728-Alexandrium_andersonii.AAC.1